MAKKRGTKTAPQAPKTPSSSSSSHKPISLRQEATGRRTTQTQVNTINPRDPKFLRLQHLKKLAVWSTKEASIPSLAAFYSRQFSVATEALGVPPDSSLLQCERCETILEPGSNCRVRIEKTSAKSSGKRKKSNTTTKNNVVYTCHFCSHRNLRRGTPKGYLKELHTFKSKQKPSAESELSKLIPEKSAALKEDLNLTKTKVEIIKIGEAALPSVSGSGDDSILNSPVTPLVTNEVKLLDAMKRKRKRKTSESKKPEESVDNSAAKDGEGTVDASSKRKRKSWTSLKEIAASNDHGSTATAANLTLPFFHMI